MATQREVDQAMAKIPAWLASLVRWSARPPYTIVRRFTLASCALAYRFLLRP